MNVGLYFGSFNPIHVGHLIIASFVAEHTDVDQVWLVVSPQNPLKKSNTLLNEYNRLHLVQLATEDDERLKTTDIEFRLPKPSYTIDTLTYIHAKYPNHNFSVIIGSDSYNNISNWKNANILLRDYRFFVYLRPGFPVEKETATVHVLNAPMLDISSTFIREQLRNSKSIKYLVPDKVLNEIEKNRYYLPGERNF